MSYGPAEQAPKVLVPAEVRQRLADSRDLLLSRLEHDQEIESTLHTFPEVQPGSVLEEDDRILGGYALSPLVLDLLKTATQISGSLRAMIVVETEGGADVSAPLHGPYALVRAHMESTSQALWLMAPQSRRARIRRCIQHWCSEVRLFNGFQHEWSKSFASRESIGYEDLRAIASEAGLTLDGFPGRKLWAPAGSGDILKSIEFAHEGAMITWFNSWQLCSGFAHSKQWASIYFNEHKGTATDGEAMASSLGSEVSLPVLATVVHEAGLLLDEASRRYGQLSTRPHAAWPR
ncbi:hypothetical protein [Arthrobacter sp. StoSoilB20]|uniref:hypothetical protein n=1 Tax=Arthrobacter sp. StoSoilB20 TaxID=2830995 RepID=UPI001CC42EED|nr:hypothetical protein [Arthrobacter sp. StoSoilB20]BCW58513.1 hypothetical protein StoSoilB20_18600 [Arthrobacter sp. StoSoilB20]